MRNRIAMLFPYAPSYRLAIYQLMDKELDIDWYFAGDAKRDLKFLDYTKLKNCNLMIRERKLGPFSYYKGLLNIPFENYTDIIIAGVPNNISEWWLALRLRCKFKSTKLYFWTHGWYGKESKLKSWLKKRLFGKADGIFLYGNYAKHLMKDEGFNEIRLHVIKNSLDYDKQLEIRNKIVPSNIYKEHFKNESPTIIFIGRLTAIKKLDLLINAVKILNQQGEKFNIIFVGDGEMREYLERLARQCDIENQVWFYGSCFDENVNAELVYNADICVAPGNIGLTAIHSLMFGCPAISHHDFKWQMPEFESIIPGQTGDFFEYGNVEDLARVISNWFACKKQSRDEVRVACYKEIDECWNPYYQLNVIKKALCID